MELELKHLAPYLPYKLKLVSPENKKGLRASMILTGRHLNDQGLFDHLYKPLLRPLSDLTQEIEHNGNTFIPAEILVGGLKPLIAKDDHIKDIMRWPQLSPFAEVQYLLEWHFDIFGLIHAGLAVDINTIKHQ